MQQRDALQVHLSHPADAVQQHEQTLVSQREALQRATAAADAAQQQLHAQADQEAQRTTGIQALQQRVSQGLATAIAQNVVTLQPAPDRLTLRVRSETLFRPGTVALRPESRDILEQIVAVLHTVPDYLCRVDGHTDDVPITGAARERFPSRELSASVRWRWSDSFRAISLPSAWWPVGMPFTVRWRRIRPRRDAPKTDA